MALTIRRDSQLLEIRDADLPAALPPEDAAYLTDPDPEAVYIVRPLTPTVLADLQRQHTRKTFDRESRAMKDTLDRDAYAEALLGHWIVDWRGIVYADTGEPVPCTADTKRDVISGKRAEALMKLSSVHATDGAADSFRRPAEVRRMVG